VVTPGTSVTLTAAPAAQARFTGWGGACTGSSPSCQLTVQGNVNVTAAFVLEVQTLVAADGTNLAVLAINSTQVFYGRRASDGDAIWSVPKAGGTPARVAPGTPNFIVADDGFVYWTTNGDIYSAPVGGGPASLLSSGIAGRLALDELGALYWVSLRTTTTPGSVHRMQDRIDAVIAAGQDTNSGVAVDATYAYFTTSSLDGVTNEVRRVPRMGGTVERLVSTGNTPAAAVRVDSQNLYYRDYSGDVWAAAKGGGSPRILSTGNHSQFHVTNIDLDANAFVVWWTWNDSPSAVQGLFRANADGSGWTAVETSSDATWGGPRVDDTAVYYFHGGALIKRLK
jgi:hypothetical protein